jgi:hypothetical protein
VGGRVTVRGAWVVRAVRRRVGGVREGEGGKVRDMGEKCVCALIKYLLLIGESGVEEPRAIEASIGLG